LQQDLDHDALQLEARKNESEERRKALVAQVKMFRGDLAEVGLNVALRQPESKLTLDLGCSKATRTNDEAISS
jgi:hypothetical protein